MSACAHCGKEYNPGVKFCTGCGKPVVAAVAAATPAVETAAKETPGPATPATAATTELPTMVGIVCPKCGNLTPARIKFCVRCGAQLASPITKTAPVPAPVAAPPTASKSEPKTPADRVCSECGAAVAAGMKFCVGCGAPFAGESKATQAGMPVPPAPPPAARPEAQAPPDRVCSKCGGTVAAGLKFCVGCGTPFPGESKATQAGIPGPLAPPADRVCSKCGGTVAAGMKFCVGCGTPFPGESKATQAGTPGPLAPPTAARPKVQAPAGESKAASPSPTAPAKPSRKSRALLPIGLVLGLAVLGAGGWFGFQKWQAGREDGQPPVQAEAPTPMPPEAQPPATSPAEQQPANPPAVTATPQASPVETPAIQAAVPARRTPAVTARSQAAPPPEQHTPAAAIPMPPTEAPQTPAAAQPTRVEQSPTPAPATAPPPQPAPAAPVQRTPAVTRPAAPPRYAGPSAGTVTWSGQMERGATIVLNGATASQGTVSGSLPGVPVMIEVEPPDVAVAEAPSPGNGWKRVALRSSKGRYTAIRVRWKTL